MSRLEEFPRSAVERVGQQHVVQYRDEILPLIHVSRVLRRLSNDGQGTKDTARARARRRTPRAADPSALVQVVVFTSKGRRLGLVVDRILDIAEETLVSRSETHRPGVSFAAVVHGRVTEFLDVEAVLRSVDPDVLEVSPATAVEA